MGARLTDRRRIARACLIAAALCLGLAPSSTAIVPPSNCGKLTVKGKRYTIKADQLRCVTARSHAARYLATHRRPSGYRCRDYGRETKLAFRCARGVKVFFAIRL